MAEGKFYWLKLKRDFFKRHDIRIIESLPNGKDYVLFYLKMLLESIDHEGELRFSDTLPYSAEMLATITNTNVDIVRAAMKVFTEFGMVEILEDKTIYMNEVQKLIGSAADNDNANRQRRYRERLKQKPVTQALPDRYASVTKSNESKSIEIEKELEDIYSPPKSDDAPKKKTPKLPDWATEVVDYLNEKTGKHFKVTSSANTRFITARAKEGYTAEDFKKVIDTKTAEWKGTDMEQYLRPETLFSASKFESYLNQRTIKKTSKNEFGNFAQHDYDMDELTKRAKRRG